MKKHFLTILTLVTSVVGLTGCGHEHTYSDEWLSNDTQHWHPATCGCADAFSELEYHVDDDNNSICDKCGRLITTPIPKPNPDPDDNPYYSSINPESSTLLSDLRTLNLSKRKNKYSYESIKDNVYKYTDYDPATIKYDSTGQPYGTKLLSFYSGDSINYGGYNKEHVWPNSRGGGSKNGLSGSPYVEDDIYMPRPTISKENSNRGNSAYVQGMCDGSAGWDPVQAFEVENPSVGIYQGIRGECARIIFYCMTVNSKLKLVDNANEDFGGSGGRVTMGKLSDLLRWNLENPVNDREKRRQSGGQYLQGNRNAFVDHPEYACKIWGTVNATTRQICGIK